MIKDGRTLVIGIIIGLAVATSLFLLEDRRRPEPAAAAPGMAADVTHPINAPADQQPSDEELSVQLTEDEQRAIGVETVEVKRKTIRKQIVAPGKVLEPETGYSTIRARVGGRIDKLLVNALGEAVNRGQPAAVIYSPEVIAAGEQYRLALRNRQRFGNNADQQATREADELVRSTQRGLELSGLGAQEIEQLALADKPTQITVYSPGFGVITKRNVSEGQDVSAGDVLFEIVDLTTVWIQADIFDSDPPLPRTGQRMKINAPALTGNSVDGVVSFLQPSLILPTSKSLWNSIEGAVSFAQPSVDPENRSLTARIQTPNPQMRLRPGMYVEVSFEKLAADVIAVPRSAVLETGKGKVIYVAKGNGIFEKRSVEASIADDGYYAVRRGIGPGEHVVIHGNFLIDSQTRLTNTITGLYSGSKAYNRETALNQSSPAYSLTLQTEPDPPKGGSEGTFRVSLIGPDKKSVTDAQVQMTLTMPAMPSMGMADMRSVVDFKWNGSRYVGKGAVAHAGPWTVRVEARRNGQVLAVHTTRFDAR